MQVEISYYLSYKWDRLTERMRRFSGLQDSRERAVVDRDHGAISPLIACKEEAFESVSCKWYRLAERIRLRPNALSYEFEVTRESLVPMMDIKRARKDKGSLCNAAKAAYEGVDIFERERLIF